MSIEVDDSGAWMFEQRTCGELPDAPLSDVLRWILQQLHFQCSRLEANDKGENVTLILGKGAALPVPEPVVETAIEHRRRRDLALNFAGLFAKYREQGIDPAYQEMAEQARMSASENAYMNTDLHYAFELTNTLQRIREKTFLLANVPLRKSWPEPVSRLLGEATRAYLFNLNRACVSLCRALLETGLREQVNATELLQERFNTKRGELECLIDLGLKDLMGIAHAKAHGIRKAGNDAMHGAEPSDDTAWAVLLDTREVLETLLKRRAA